MKVKVYDNDDKLIEESSGEIIIVAVADEKDDLIIPSMMGTNGNYTNITRLYVGLGGYINERLQEIIKGTSK